MTEKLTDLFHFMRKEEAIPQEFKDASISTYTCGKEILKSATTTEASLKFMIIAMTLILILTFFVVLLMVYTFRNLLGLLESAIKLQTSTLEINV